MVQCLLSPRRRPEVDQGKYTIQWSHGKPDVWTGLCGTGGLYYPRESRDCRFVSESARRRSVKR
ncbi:hypothetical protein RUND412_006770, partial [Rhizina undulata]